MPTSNTPYSARDLEAASCLSQPRDVWCRRVGILRPKGHHDTAVKARD